MPAFRVLLTDYAWPDLEIERALLSSIDAELVVADDSAPARLADLAAGADAIMTCWAETTEEVIAAASNCRIVARLGIGLDNIDVDYCTRQGILVTNVPDYCVVEVAEHTLALMFALARNVAEFHRASKNNLYDLAHAPPLIRLEGSTVGVVGLGRIGGLVAAKAHALGMRTLAYTRRRDAVQAPTQFADLDELLAKSRFVSLHVPLTNDTHHLIGTEQLRLMSKDAFLINTARGGLVDHAALAAALETNRLQGAALDVQDPEPPPLDQPPFNSPRVLVTPHAAFVSEHSVSELRRRATSQVVDCLSGRVPENVVNR